MSGIPTRGDVAARLSEAGIAWAEIPLGGGRDIIVSALGGRVYGPFTPGSEGTSANWVPAFFGSREEFARFRASGHWNVGGERHWIGPEIAFMIGDRADYWGSYVLPPAMDPAEYRLVTVPGGVRLETAMELRSHLPGAGSVRLTLAVEITPAAHPLRYLAGGTGATSYAGYSSAVELTVDGPSGQQAESWNLNQVPGGGTALIPAFSEVEVTDYYEPVGENLRRIPGGVAVDLPGDTRFKIGFAAAQISGRLGHLSAADSAGRHTLTVRNFPNDPSSDYSEEPDFSTHRGDSLHLYDDDGGLGGFAELEARGHGVGGQDGQTRSRDRFTTWSFWGTPAELAPVAQTLLGLSLPDSTQG